MRGHVSIIIVILADAQDSSPILGPLEEEKKTEGKKGTDKEGKIVNHYARTHASERAKEKKTETAMHNRDIYTIQRLE